MDKLPHRLLLLSPRFFGYESELVKAARRRGMNVHWIDGRAYTSAIYKSALKLAPVLTRSLTQRALIAKLDQYDWSKPPTEILIIKGDGITLSTLHRIRARAPNARVILYSWDNVKNVSGFIELSRAVDRCVTFDPKDAEAFGWDFLPLFIRQPPCMLSQNVENRYDWSFVGSVHSDRHRTLRQLVDSFGGNRWYVHAYVPTVLARLRYSLGDLGLIFPSKVKLTNKVLSPSELDCISAQSTAVIDIHHPLQVGLTMRTLETLLQGRKLITTNETLKMYDLYHPSRVAILDRHNPQIDPDFLHAPFEPISDDISQRYYIDNWLAKLITEEHVDKL
jgi:hypothetical protein